MNITEENLIKRLQEIKRVACSKDIARHEVTIMYNMVDDLILDILNIKEFDDFNYLDKQEEKR